MKKVFALIMLLALSVGIPARAQVNQYARISPSGPLVPRTGALFGAFVGPTLSSMSIDQLKANISQLENIIGRKLAIDMHFYKLNRVFPTELEQWDVDNGRIPLITWCSPPLNDVVQGVYDNLFKERANALKQFGRPVFFRWAWEMNGNWYLWSGALNGKNPALYVAAWRHVHDIFVSEGANNVVWVWAPSSTKVPDATWNKTADYYPGDNYVDWIGVDGYNRGDNDWRSLQDIFAKFYSHWAAVAPNKPIMISETGAVEEGGDKAAWLSIIAGTLKKDFPKVKAFVYFDSRPIKETKPWDFRVTTSPSAQAAFSTLANDPYFCP